MRTALDIYTRLRTQAAGGQPDTPCDDKDIELTLARHLQLMGDKVSQQQALDIFTWLRTQAAGQPNIPCDDKDIELGIAAILVDMGAWKQFDELQLEKQLFSGFEASLYFSIRNFRELIEVEATLPKQTDLLGKALRWAALAVEKSRGTSASCLSQLGHCFRLISVWPKPMLETLGIEEEREEEFKHRVKVLFAKANDVEPHRQELKKDEPWRVKEHQLLAHMTA
ncbi:hypothetical protein [Sansalvadorimonas verongulae]|uniref:hypothetical protein n=1 Tax=Sansalvadorimonas verongulae TaxID=2172824 RepID=UPI0012BC9488|nr:hypothetical protein [Sansalvadorimonas verongulae]MTI11662.1 hypothetical protein [Sansalvadorimonas verongulae]